MRREVQVHFDNQGQLSWHEYIADVEKWLSENAHKKICLAKDRETDRYFAFDTSKVTAFIVVNKIAENDSDPYRRLYATKEGEKQEGDQREHQGNVGLRTSTEASCGC